MLVFKYTIKLVLEDTLIFLIEVYLKIVLDNFQKIYHCKVNLCNIYIKLYKICINRKLLNLSGSILLKVLEI